MTYTLNQHIIVTAVRFTAQFRVIPKRIELDGVPYDVEIDTTDTAEINRLSLRSHESRFQLSRPNEHEDWRLTGISTLVAA